MWSIYLLSVLGVVIRIHLTVNRSPRCLFGLLVHFTVMATCSHQLGKFYTVQSQCFPHYTTCVPYSLTVCVHIALHYYVYSLQKPCQGFRKVNFNLSKSLTKLQGNINIIGSTITTLKDLCLCSIFKSLYSYYYYFNFSRLYQKVILNLMICYTISRYLSHKELRNLQIVPHCL